MITVKLWVGPTGVSEIADRLRNSTTNICRDKLGMRPMFDNIIEGTEHVIVTVDATTRVTATDTIRQLVPWADPEVVKEGA